MSIPPKILTVMLVAGLAGCTGATGNPDLATEFRETPLRMLPGVQVGMQARQLKRARPGTHYVPYFGLAETIPGYQVSYRFESAVGENADSDVSARDDLQAVYMMRAFRADESALAAWREQVSSLISGRRAPDQCDALPGGGQQARWFSGRMVLAIGAFPKSPTSPSARLLYAVSPIEKLKQPEGTTSVPCPKS